MTKKLISLFIIIFGLFFIASLGRNVYDLTRTSKQIEKAGKKVAGLGKDQEELKKQLEYVKSEQFVEKEAREKLNFVKEGEVVVVLPKENSNQTPDDSDQKPLPNWQKWLKILFDRKEDD
jgi:cell division protein FtsB